MFKSTVNGIEKECWSLLATLDISSTINLAEDVEPEVISDIYFMAWQKKSKGVTIYRDGSRFPILSVENKLTEFQKYKDKKFEILNEDGEKVTVGGDHVLKCDDGRLTTLYHYMNSNQSSQSNTISTMETAKLKETKNA